MRRFFLAMVWAWPLAGCSAVMCAGDGMEVNRDFTVLVRHQDKGLPNVQVEVSGPGGARSSVTGPDGSLRFAKLAPGTYWLKADYLGIGAAWHCFHVAARSSLWAKRRLKYSWGDFPMSVRQVLGQISDPQPGEGENALQRMLHRVQVPVGKARLTLRHVLKEEVLATTTDAAGTFSFGTVAPGPYVLRVEGGETGAYDATVVLLDVRPDAQGRSLSMLRSDFSAGSCGNRLEIRAK